MTAHQPSGTTQMGRLLGLKEYKLPAKISFVPDGATPLHDQNGPSTYAKALCEAGFALSEAVRSGADSGGLGRYEL